MKSMFLREHSQSHVHAEVSQMWLDYYHELTGREGKPGYDANGSLLWWIAEYSPNFQTELLHMCYEAGYNAGLVAASHCSYSAR